VAVALEVARRSGCLMFPSPSLVVPSLEDFQWSYNGLKLGANTPYGVLGAEGFNMADIRNSDGGWPRDHGQALGLDLLGGQDILLDLWMKSDGTSLQHAQTALAAATRVQPGEETPLWFKLPNLQTMCLMTRPRKRKSKIDSDYASGNIGKPELSLHATDPRFYEHGRETVINLGPLAGGKVTAGKLVVTNGNMEMRPIIVFTGKLRNPSIGNLTIAGHPTLKLEPTEWLECELTEGSKVVKGVGSTSLMFVGGKVEGKRIARGTTVAKILGAKEVELSAVVEGGEAKTIKETVAFPRSLSATDQLLVDLGTPHRIVYYPEGIGHEKPENVAGWLNMETAVWWDLLPELNELSFISEDVEATGGTATLQWAPAWEL
jgi:hypothetical protein